MLLQAGRNHEIDLAHRGIACFAHQKTEPKQKISLIVIKWLGTTKIYLHSKGDEFSASEFSDDQTDLREAYLHPDAEDLIRGMIIKAFHEKLSFSYHNEKNCIRVIVGESSQKNLFYALCVLGATINMDGLSLTLSLTTLFFANAFGITITPADLLSLIITIIILSIGTPGIPGAGILCLTILFKQYGIPIEARSIFIGVYSLLDPINSANNVFGDVTGSYVVAKRNGLMQQESKSP